MATGYRFTEIPFFPTIPHMAVALTPGTEITVSMPGFVTSTLEGTRTITVSQ